MIIIYLFASYGDSRPIHNIVESSLYIYSCGKKFFFYILQLDVFPSHGDNKPTSIISTCIKLGFYILPEVSGCEADSVSVLEVVNCFR